MIRKSTVRFIFLSVIVALLSATNEAEDARNQWLEDTKWIMVLAFVFAFMLAFAVGANDVANSFGTAVGSKVLTMKQAFLMASIFETSGAILLGGSVGATIRKGIVSEESYLGEIFDNSTYNLTTGDEFSKFYADKYYSTSRQQNVTLLMYGQVSAMFGAASWQILATLFKLPVSGTHSIVGAIVGFHVACKGWDGIGYSKLFKIVMSWFLSPVLAGMASVSLYCFLHRRVLIPTQQFSATDNEKGERLALILLPIFYFVTMFINVYALAHHQEDSGLLSRVPNKGVVSILIALIIGLISSALSYRFIVLKFKTQWSQAKTVQNGTNGGDTVNLSQTKPEGKLNAEEPQLTGHNRGSLACLREMNMTPQAPLMTARLLSHVERNDSFTSNRVPNSYSSNRVRLTSGGAISLPPTITSANRLKFLSESSDAGIVLKPNIKEEDYDFDEKDLDNVVFEEEPENERTASTLRVNKLFEKLQIMTSCFGAFAHGGNDVSNAIGPLVAIYMYRLIGGLQIPEEVFGINPYMVTPWYLLGFGGIGITVGLWCCGEKLIRAMGEDITTITPVRGFCIELMSAFTVLGASVAGMPVSTTHCKVGSIVAIGIYGRTGVPKRQILNIALAWIVTVPTSAVLSGLIMKFILFLKPIE